MGGKRENVVKGRVTEAFDFVENNGLMRRRLGSRLVELGDKDGHWLSQIEVVIHCNTSSMFSST